MGPLAGVKVIEIAGMGPAPFTAMMLADMGAEVVRVDRPEPQLWGDPTRELLNRGRPSVVIDLKHPDGREAALRLIDQADALVEGFRPGVMERLGLGPDDCLVRNPRLVYGRVTGYGRSGPLAQAPGHDINFIALAGALRCFARSGERPVPPLNLVGDFGGGGMLLAFGVACALIETSRSGQGQVVDAAMVDGIAVLMTMVYALAAQGLWNDSSGENLLDTGAPFYDVYETADQKYLGVGALEPRFYAELIERAGLDRRPEGDESQPHQPHQSHQPHQLDRSQWPAMRQRWAELFRAKTRAEWSELLEGTDACVTPVLSFAEAPFHPHNQARDTFVTVDDIIQPAPAPRFSRTPPSLGRPPSTPGADTDEVLAAWGFTSTEIANLRAAGAVA